MKMLSQIALAIRMIGGDATLEGAHAPLRKVTQTAIATRYADFHDPKSVADLDERLKLAAVKACGSGASNNRGVFQKDRRCAHKSWQAAVRSLHEPMLSQRHGQNMLLASNN